MDTSRSTSTVGMSVDLCPVCGGEVGDAAVLSADREIVNWVRTCLECGYEITEKDGTLKQGPPTYYLTPEEEQALVRAFHRQVKLIDEGMKMQERKPDVPAREQGLFRKYEVTRLDGKPVAGAFVLEFGDKFAPAALEAYADACEAEYPELAKDLRATAIRIR